MQKAKLLKLADFLDSVPRKKFDIGCFASKDNECITAACACGWATVCFPRARLSLVPLFGKKYNLQYDNSNGSFCGMDAAVEFFKINENDAIYLFSPGEYSEYHYNPTPKVVAKRIRKFVNEH